MDKTALIDAHRAALHATLDDLRALLHESFM